MMELTYLLFLAAVAIGMFHLLPRTRGDRPAGIPLILFAGFILTEVGLSGLVGQLGLVPKGPFHDLLHAINAKRDERPAVLLIGSSFTEAGVDPDELAVTLGNGGSDATVHRLAIGGAPHLERLHYLKEYLTRIDRSPKLVLFEIAGGYDDGPLYQVHQMRFSDRMVAMMDGANAWWALGWVAGANNISLFQRIDLAGEILAQLALHVSHIALFWNTAPVTGAAEYNTGGLPPPIHFSDAEAGKLLEKAAAERALRPDWPQDVPTRWMRALLAEEMAVLRSHGVDRFAFYSVPSMQGANVVYARRFCAAMREFPCIVGEDPTLLAMLQRGDEWHDFDHLRGMGGKLFTRWLGDRLIKAGLWP